MHEVLFSCEPFSVFGAMLEVLYGVVVIIDTIIVFIEFGLQLFDLPISFRLLDEALFAAANKYQHRDKTGDDVFVEQIFFVFPYEIFRIHIANWKSVQKYKFFSKVTTLRRKDSKNRGAWCGFVDGGRGQLTINN